MHAQYTPIRDNCGHDEPVVTTLQFLNKERHESVEDVSEPSSTHDSAMCSPGRVHVSAISPLHTRQPSMTKRRGKCTKTEVLTSSPYKTALSVAKFNTAMRSGSKKAKKSVSKPASRTRNFFSYQCSGHGPVSTA